MATSGDTDILPGRSGLGGRVAAIFENRSRQPFGADETGPSFLELGFDSLLLTQAAQGLQTTFGVQIRFSQLLDDLRSTTSRAILPSFSGKQGRHPSPRRSGRWRYAHRPWPGAAHARGSCPAELPAICVATASEAG
jgi:acyl carrier protein